MIARIVLVMPSCPLRKQLMELLSQQDNVVETVGGRKRLWGRLSGITADMFIASQSVLPDPGMDEIEVLQNLPDSPDVILISEKENADERARFLAAGCKAVLPDHLPAEEISAVVATVLQGRAGTLAEHLTLRQAVPFTPRLSNFVSSSPSMQTFMNIVRKVTTSDCALLILGETGVGKEHLARGIHAESTRSEKPFIAVNCGALPETLLESELFGHEEGAFTGATRARRGCFEIAHEGTIFLDEIGEMPNHLQVKLLRILQDHRIQRLGGEKSFDVSVRVIAASNRDLEAEAKEGSFRRDLYYRLGVVTLNVPPLKERVEDISELVSSYINHYCTQTSASIQGVTDETLKALKHYEWPGNVRELMNVIERAVLLCEDDELSLADLPRGIVEAAGTFLPLSSGRKGLTEGLLNKNLAEARNGVLERFERDYLAALLTDTNGKIDETAKRAGIVPRSLYDKMKKYGLKKEDFRSL